MWLVSAAVEMPSILFGDLKGGLSQESDAYQRYARMILTRSDSYFRPVVQKVLCVFALMHDINDAIEFEFNSLIQDELNNAKVDSIKSYIEALDSLINLNLFSKYQAARCLDNFMHKNVIDITFTEEQFEKLQLEEELELLEVYKAMGKEKTTPPAGEGQFPEGIPQDVDLPEKLEYLRESEVPTQVVETNTAEAATGSVAQQPELQNEVIENVPDEEDE